MKIVKNLARSKIEVCACISRQALLLNNKKILIAKRRSADKLANKWEFPGGKIEEGETPEECLRREIMEEFGINIRVGDYFCSSQYHYEEGDIELMAYWCTCEEDKLALNPTVHDDFRWVSFAKLQTYDFAPADKPLVEKILVLDEYL
ncbi:MAG: (deoxy)nucleoside triphosphate pyrophosphohydrolase [Bacillota bacterium]